MGDRRSCRLNMISVNIHAPMNKKIKSGAYSTAEGTDIKTLLEELGEASTEDYLFVLNGTNVPETAGLSDQDKISIFTLLDGG